MNFNEHYELRNKHAFFSPSKYYWLRWDEDKIKNEYKTKWANKETLSEEDKKEMSEMKRYFDDLEEEGYIG